ncbi:phage terminase large subunit family protein [Meiothermus sp. Pnk-1]|uniref:phage terminase large subunit family protein n=1 Tax=Meiothermus sp. Pnk-1 TaxID=873128 RepID=UPI000D7BDDB0|nr:phage terminase large subunit family protein [Meiothermus sp. Pnk-1]PZA08276.1 hypothetical protein DNA98_03820 [Meiothermus sp. Pnk-1]
MLPYENRLVQGFLERIAPPTPEFSPEELATLESFARASGIRPEGPGGPPFSLEGREYMQPLYDERREDPYYRLVIMKSAQLGLTIHELYRGAWFTADARRRVNVGFFFPSQNAVYDLSASRFKPMFQNASRMMRLADAGGLARVDVVRFGVSVMRFRGMKSGVSMDSVPLDALLFDEVRLMSRAAIERVQKRVLESKHVSPTGLKGIIQLGSTAGFPDSDIHAYFLQSDQHWFMTRCPGPLCENRHGFNLAQAWVDTQGAVVNASDPADLHYRCPRCGRRIEHVLEGDWERLGPADAEWRGYQMNRTLKGPRELPQLWRNFQTMVVGGVNPAEFYNSDLGLPHKDPNAVIVTAAVFNEGKQVDPDYHWPLEPERPPRAAARAFGIDQKPGQKHVLIAEWGPNGRIYPVHLEIVEEEGVDERGKDRAVERTVAILRQWNVDVGVVDAEPSFDYALGVAQRMPRGAVWLADYLDDRDQPLEWSDQRGSEKISLSKREAKYEYWVKIDRYKHLLQAFTLFRHHRVAVPVDLERKGQELWVDGTRKWVSLGDEWRRHMGNIARTSLPRRRKHPETGEIIDEGKFSYTFRHLSVEPDFAHAWGFCVAALMRDAGSTQMVPTTPPPTHRTGTLQDQLPEALRPVALAKKVDKTCSSCQFFTPNPNGQGLGRCESPTLRRAMGIPVEGVLSTAPTHSNCAHWKKR